MCVLQSPSRSFLFRDCCSSEGFKLTIMKPSLHTCSVSSCPLLHLDSLLQVLQFRSLSISSRLSISWHTTVCNNLIWCFVACGISFMSFLVFYFIPGHSFSSFGDWLKVYGFSCLCKNYRDNDVSQLMISRSFCLLFVCVCVHVSIINFCTFLLFPSFHCLWAFLALAF